MTLTTKPFGIRVSAEDSRLTPLGHGSKIGQFQSFNGRKTITVFSVFIATAGYTIGVRTAAIYYKGGGRILIKAIDFKL